MAPPTCNFILPGSEPDVQVVTLSREFHLHSQVLRLSSRWFAASMSEVWWNPESSIGSFKYCYYLNFDKDGVSTLLPRRDQEPTKTEPSTSSKDPPATENLCPIFEKMFRCFYRMPAHAMTLDECTALISLADQYDALDSVSGWVRASLFEWEIEEGVDGPIRDAPIHFLIIAYKMKSPRIFREAFIHIVGRQCGQPDISEYWWDSNIDIPKSVMRLIKSESKRLNRLTANAMRTFLRLDPALPKLSEDDDRRDKGTIRNQLGRLFEAHGAPGEEGVLFRSISESTFSRSTTEQLERNRAGIRNNPVAHNHLVQLFKDVAKELIVNNLRSKKDMPYLTCARLWDEELPWTY